MSTQTTYDHRWNRWNNWPNAFVKNNAKSVHLGKTAYTPNDFFQKKITRGGEAPPPKVDKVDNYKKYIWEGDYNEKFKGKIWTHRGW